MLNRTLSLKQATLLSVGIIMLIAIIPAFFPLPYRVNIFLSWEGAYRLTQGQAPYTDFGLPMGYGFWLIPALFFKIFGANLITLVKAQVFINILSGLAFLSILRSFGLSAGRMIVLTFLYCLSYSFINFWPWYNHSVIVFEFVAFAFLFRYLMQGKSWINLSLSALFLFLSFFTKQDGGGLAILITGFLLLYHAVLNREYKTMLIYAGSFILFAAVFILPFDVREFGYWFNHGQPPHYSRLNAYDFILEWFNDSFIEKLYLMMILVISLPDLINFKEFIRNEKKFLFFLFTVGIFVQALIFKVTSYTPPNTNIFYHSFGMAYLLSRLSIPIKFDKVSTVVVLTFLVGLWWSGNYWKYTNRIISRAFPALVAPSENEDIISKSTYVVGQDAAEEDMKAWVFSDLPSFRNVYMPESTVNGMKKLMQMDEIRRSEHPRVLNMSELTPLAREIPFELETGKPLWYHKGVAIFDDQISAYCMEIEAGKYDVVLFETIPYLNNFYPAEVYDCLMEHYEVADKFLAPRRPSDSWIEVFVRKDH